MEAHRFSFEKLLVWQEAKDLTVQVYQLTRDFPSEEKFALVQQIRRSATSVCANIAEGTGRGTLQDNRRFIRMARGSLYETQHWLRRSYKRALLSKQQIADLKPIIAELSPTLNAYFRSVNEAASKLGVQSTKLKVQSSKS